VEAASLMLPLLALDRVVTSLVLPAEPRRMSVPLVPTRFSMLLNCSKFHMELDVDGNGKRNGDADGISI
jgi:hypothetical protein